MSNMISLLNLRTACGCTSIKEWDGSPPPEFHLALCRAQMWDDDDKAALTKPLTLRRTFVRNSRPPEELYPHPGLDVHVIHFFYDERIEDA